AGGKDLRVFLAEIVDAAGIEHALHVTCDRTGVPSVDGGVSLTARDLARYLSLFARRGEGVNGEKVGSAAFLDAALRGGVPMQAPYIGIRYSNHLMTFGSHVGHGGWGGQFALANVD